jgi:hypothetical protein
LSVAVGATKEDVGVGGLQPRKGIVVIPVITGFTMSEVQLMV